MSEDKAGEKVEWINTERLVEGFFKVEKVRFKHRMQSGEMSPELTWYLLRRPDAVCALVYNTDRDMIYFVKQFRLGMVEKGDPAWSVELAAGVVDPGETTREAIIREVYEELGFKVTDVEEVQKIYPSPAILSERIVLYYIEVTDSQRLTQGGGTDHEHEDLEIFEVSVSGAQDFMREQRITDSKTLIGLMWFLSKQQTPKMRKA